MEIYKLTFTKKGVKYKLRIWKPRKRGYSVNATLSTGNKKYGFYVTKEMIEDEVALINCFKDYVNELSKK